MWFAGSTLKKELEDDKQLKHTSVTPSCSLNKKGSPRLSASVSLEMAKGRGLFNQPLNSRQFLPAQHFLTP